MSSSRWRLQAPRSPSALAYGWHTSPPLLPRPQMVMGQSRTHCMDAALLSAKVGIKCPRVEIHPPDSLGFHLEFHFRVHPSFLTTTPSSPRKMTKTMLPGSSKPSRLAPCCRRRIWRSFERGWRPGENAGRLRPPYTAMAPAPRQNVAG